MRTLVNPRRLESLNTVPKHHFINAPLSHELERLVSGGEPLYLVVTQQEQGGRFFHEQCILSVVPYKEKWQRLKSCTIVRGVVLVAEHLLQPRWELCQSRFFTRGAEVQLVFYPNKTDRHGFFILGDTGYTLFPDWT
jgi:hypothetical protein